MTHLRWRASRWLCLEAPGGLPPVDSRCTGQGFGRFSGMSGHRFARIPWGRSLSAGRSVTVEETPAGRSWMLWALAVTAIGILTGVLVLVVASSRLEPTALRVFFVAWIVVPYVVGGAVAWWRRPTSRFGPLMLLTGIAMALNPLQWSTQPWAHSIGHLLDMLPAAMFLHVFLAFPSGRVRDRAERVLVVAAYAITVGLQVVKIALGINPDNVLTVVAAPAAGNVVESIQL